MNTTLFSQFSPAIRDINTKADSPTLLLGAQGPLSIYYAPFDALNDCGKLGRRDVVQWTLCQRRQQVFI